MSLNSLLLRQRTEIERQIKTYFNNFMKHSVTTNRINTEKNISSRIFRVSSYSGKDMVLKPQCLLVALWGHILMLSAKLRQIYDPRLTPVPSALQIYEQAAAYHPFSALNFVIKYLKT